ncbi:DgyrCDS10506 [Dimorphilus gyrociliatus]|uniref:DgyrCDS10506 n=1 Tax=Dimorphilus gyrociliatus TaxID=2664684 RepID=A0A7I8W5I3_9ANNE|nr:DgyrCDS10506 [Dimorphilus gyrociliatus]
MGAFLDKPKTEKHNSEDSGNNIRYGIGSMQGWRVEMEDAHSAKIGLDNHKDWAFFAVFDGHAGTGISIHSSAHLLNCIQANQDFTLGITSCENVVIQKGIREGFLELDEAMRSLPDVVQNSDKSGTTAISCFVSPKYYYFANCGDSRGVLSRNNSVLFATEDHKPTNPNERARIENAGGSVLIQRVNGSLAVSRALGDYEYKCKPELGPCEQMVSPEPDVTVIERKSDDEFMVLACDGVWDVMTNDEVCDFVRDRMAACEHLTDVCNQLLDTCLHKGSRDNMSVVIVAFEGAPKFSEAAKERDEQLNEIIRKKVTELCADDGTLNEAGPSLVNHVMNCLDSVRLELPPGGGLQSKRHLVEELVRELVPNNNSDSESSPPVLSLFPKAS